MKKIVCFILIAILFGLGCSKESEQLPKANPKAKMITIDGEFFSINIPENWEIITAGECSNFAFLIRNRQNFLQQGFYFSTVGPFYVNEKQRTIDFDFMNSDGFPIAWNEMPTINPLIPSNFLKQFHLIADTEAMQLFMPECPGLEKLRVISSKKIPCPLGKDRGETELIKAAFLQDGQDCEGLFLVTVSPYMPFDGNAAGGTAYGMMFTGISAAKSDFKTIEKNLRRSMETFMIKKEYASICPSQTDAIYAGLNKPGKIINGLLTP
jgi:hypothetical protein